MSADNGYALHRLDVVEQDTRDLRQLVLDEFRALRSELKHIKELGQHNAKALDLLLAHAQLDEASGE